MNIDLQKTPAQNLVALLNSLNGTSLVEANLAFSDAQALTEQNTNSRVLVAGGSTPVFAGSDYLYYNRATAAATLGNANSIEVTVTAGMNDAQVYAAAMARFPLQGSEWRFVAAQMPVGTERPGMLLIAAKSDSLLYVGNYSFTLVIAP